MLHIEILRNQHGCMWKLFENDCAIVRSARSKMTYEEAVDDAKAFLALFDGRQHYVGIV